MTSKGGPRSKDAKVKGTRSDRARPKTGRKGSPAPDGAKAKRGNNPPVPNGDGPGLLKRVLPYLDAIFFLILMLSASVLVLFVLPAVYEGGDREEDAGMADLCTRTSQALLMSTVPYCSYTDTQGHMVQYLDQTVSYLICQELYIRTCHKATLDPPALRQGIELAVSQAATGLLMDGYGFLLNASATDGAMVQLFNYKGREASPTAIDPSNAEVVEIQRDTEGRALHSTSSYILPDGKEARVAFYLFKTASFDTEAVLEGGA